MLVCLAVTGVTAAAPSPVSWTVMAYLDGDRDLQPAARHYLEQLLGYPQHPQVKVVVQVNMQADEGAGSGIVRYYRDERGGRGSEAARPTDVGSERLANFVKWSVEQAPAACYALLIMGHGERLVPALSRDDPAMVAGQSLSAKEIATALGEAERCAGTGRLETVFMDCCYGATLEVIWALRGVAHYLVGAPGPMYSPGLPWGNILRHLVQQPQAKGRDLAEAAVRAGGTFWQAEPEVPVALLAVDLQRLDSLMQALTRLSQTAVGQMAAVAPELALARSRTVAWGPQTNVADLGGFANVLAEVSASPALAQRAWELAQAVREATVASYIQGPNTRGKARGTGLGMFFPLNLGQTGLPAGYEQVAQVSEQSGWGRFLQSYLTQLRQLLWASQEQV